MPITFTNSSLPFKPGGLRKATEPATLPPVVLALWVDAANQVQRGIIDIVPDADPLPGEIAWEQVIKYVDVMLIR